MKEESVPEIVSLHSPGSKAKRRISFSFLSEDTALYLKSDSAFCGLEVAMVLDGNILTASLAKEWIGAFLTAEHQKVRMEEFLVCKTRKS